MVSSVERKSGELTAEEALVARQKLVGEKLAVTTIKITQVVLRELLLETFTPSSDFVEKKITRMQAALAALDERTSKFSQKMMKAVNEEINKLPGLSTSFEKFAKVTEDSEIRNKLISSLGLPHVQTLMKELDSMKSTIVDDINAA